MGSSIQKMLPSPCRLVTPVAPPMASTSWRDSERPSPVPSIPALAASSRSKGMNNRAMSRWASLVGRSQRPVCVLQFSRAGEDLGLHLLCAQLQLFSHLLLFGLMVPEPHVLCDILHPVDDVGEPAERAKDRRVHRAPVADLESAAGRFRSSDVVPLHRHRVGHQIPAYPVQRAAQVRLACCLRIVGVVGEHIEDVLADDVSAAGHGVAQVAVAGSDDHELRVKNQVRSGADSKSTRKSGAGHARCWPAAPAPALAPVFACAPTSAAPVPAAASLFAGPPLSAGAPTSAAP